MERELEQVEEKRGMMDSVKHRGIAFFAAVRQGGVFKRKHHPKEEKKWQLNTW